MHTADLAHKKPIEATHHHHTTYRRRVTRRYGDPLTDLAFLAGIATGTHLAYTLIVH